MSPKAPRRINIFIHVGRGRKWVAEIGQLCCRAKRAFTSPLGNSAEEFYATPLPASVRNVLSIHCPADVSPDPLLMSPPPPAIFFSGRNLNTDRRARGGCALPVVSVVSYCLLRMTWHPGRVWILRRKTFRRNLWPQLCETVTVKRPVLQNLTLYITSFRRI